LYKIPDDPELGGCPLVKQQIEIDRLKKQQCSWATERHDEECDLVAGANKTIAELRAELADSECGQHNLKNKVLELEEYVAQYKKDVEVANKGWEAAEAISVRLASQNETLRAALHSVAHWREEAHEHDVDMGHEKRDFSDEDWELLEKFAKSVLAGVST
jgi:chromosome segregation ATPase